MKKHIILIFFFVAGISFAQTLPTTENYLYSKTCLDADCVKKAQTVQYFDGLGRPKQIVGVKASPTQKDVVQYIEYDSFGRQVKDYLPIPQTGTQNGAIYTNPLSNATNIYGNEKIYTEKILENSPLERILAQKSIGNDWDTKPTNFAYDTNTAGEVKKYTTTTTWVQNRTQSNLVESGTYGANLLIKNTVTDADGNSTTEFKNGQGQTLLLRKTLSATENVDTYYVYNEFGQQVYVIPPLAAVSTTLDQATLDNLCYQYRYDNWGKLVERKIPGKGWDYLVYDKQDRLLMSQDANLNAVGQWLFTKYDQFGRVVYTGITTAADRNTVQTMVSNNTTNPQNNETKTTTTFTNGTMVVYYTNTAFPTNITKLLSVNYYDTYPTGTPTIPTQILGQNVLTENAQTTTTKTLPTASCTKNIENDGWTQNYIWYDTKARPIGSHTINYLGGYTKTETELDFVGIPQKSNVYHKRNQGSVEVAVKQRFIYTSNNILLQSYHQVNNQPEVLLSENQYNELGQLTNKKVGGLSSFGGVGGGFLQSIDYQYNIRGWLTKINNPEDLQNKLFGYEMRYQNPKNQNISTGKYNGNITEIDWKVANNEVLKRYNYQYDKLNRLTNAVFANPNASIPENNWNNETVSYDKNGNITSLQRNARNQNTDFAELIDNLNYTYNGNQLSSVDDESQNPTGYEGGGNDIAYDANGNMLNMQDKQINQITYNLLNLPNTVKIQENKKKMFYLYRADGAKLKKIFQYTKEDGGTFSAITDYLDGFQYLTTVGSQPSEADPIKYAYEQEAFLQETLQEKPNPTLQFFPTSEGFYDFENNQYIYQYKDHLGNVRVSYNQNLEITDQNDYYAFGSNIPREEKAVFGEASLYNYKFGSKELQETGFYDFGARMLMTDLGRWATIDPLSEGNFSENPYNYVLNNPVNLIDPDGRLQKEHYQKPEGSEGFFSSGGGGFADYFAGGGSGFSSSINSYLGNTGSGWGTGFGSSSKTFGQTGAYASIMSAYNAGGTASLTNTNGVMKWWTDIPDSSDAEGNLVQGVGEFHMSKVGQSGNSWNNEFHGGSFGLGHGLNYVGDNIIGTRGKFGGTTPRTSIASQYFRSTSWANNKVAKSYQRLFFNKNLQRLTTAKWGAWAGRATPALGRGVVVLSAGMSIYNVATADNKILAVSRETGGWAGAYAGAQMGAELGATIGSLFPGAGTLVGGVVGGVIGGAIGYGYGADMGEGIYNDINP